MANILSGKDVAAALNAQLVERSAALQAKGVTPTLAIVRVGENGSDLSYERGATKRAEAVGVKIVNFVLPVDCTKEELIAVIDQVNNDPAIHGTQVHFFRKKYLFQSFGIDHNFIFRNFKYLLFITI